MKSDHYLSHLTCVVVAFMAASLSAEAEDVKPIDVDRIAGVYVVAPATPVEQRAIRQLKQGMKKLYGVTLKDVADPKAVGQGKALIVLGRKAALSGGLVTEAELSRVKPGGYAIKCGGDRIVIAGEDGWCTLYGVLEFLERLGVRFYARTHIHFPKLEARTIAPYTLFDRPVFVFRNGWNVLLRQCHATLGDPRKGLNPELFTKKAGSDLWIDHTAGYLVPKALYYDKHPEYYPIRKSGKRIAKDAFSDHRTPLCLSNPDVTKVSIERALGWIDRNQEQRFFMITHGDISIWCQCPECLKLDPAPGEYATRLLHWVNGVARGVAAKYPDKILLTFAYAGSDKAPPVARPEKNVYMVAATGCGFFPFWEHAFKENNKGIHAQREKIEQWVAIAPHQVAVCEYLGAYEPSVIDKMTGRLRYYASIGLRGINATYGAPINFRPVWNYVWPKMSWNPQRDGLAIAKEFIKSYYGPAGPHIARFFELTHKQYQATLASNEKLTDTHYPPNYYSPEFCRQTMDCFEKAVKAVAGDAKLKKEIQTEQFRFIGDMVANLPSYDLSEKSNKQLLGYLDKQRELSRLTGTEIQFIRQTQSFAARVEKKHAGYRDLIGKWLGGAPDMTPIKVKNGLKFTPRMFLWGDYGPANFPASDCWSHVKFPCPPRFCVGVRAAGSRRGRSNSTMMQAGFKLEAVPGDGSGSLDIWAQDAIRYWAEPHEFDKLVHIAISINGKRIFSGEAGFVRANWSKRTFKVPAGTLKAGYNVIEIRNITPKLPNVDPYHVCWFLLSEATLRFGPAN